MNNLKAVIIATKGTTSNLLFEALSKHMAIKKVIIETPISKRVIIKQRLKRLGFLRVLGQLLFLTLALPILKIRSKRRIKEIIEQYGYSNQSIPQNLIHYINSVNGSEAIEVVNAVKPDLIFINGTRIISKKILDRWPVKPINIHVGITPKYRGIHGGYWALYHDDQALFGVTVHHVDSGIDSGGVIAQSTFKPQRHDNFLTYPILQYCEGLKLMAEIKDFEDISYVQPLTEDSQLFYHPTLLLYLKKRLFRGIK